MGIVSRPGLGLDAFVIPNMRQNGYEDGVGYHSIRSHEYDSV